MADSGGFAAGLVGVVLDGRYRLDAVLGEGGMGSVFRAQHLAMDRKVAVKLLKPHLTTDQGALQRFAREARSTLKVDSPHAVKVLDFGVTPQNDYYIVLEYLDGRTVQRELEVDGPFAPSRVLHIARHALHALGAAHASGLVHRDLKPDNILLMKVDDDPDYAKLLDFGVAKLMEGHAVSEKSRFALTQQGMVFGTPEFMSPEQACGHVLDGRSDIYSLAATMFAMLTGCALFEGRSAIELLTHHARTPPPHLDALQPELGQFPKLDELLQRCLAKRREERPETAELDQLLAQLEVYVSRGGAAAKSNRALTIMSGSSFIEALPASTLPSADTPVTSPEKKADPLTLTLTPTPTADDAALDVPPTSRRGLFLALGGILVLALVVVTIALATRKHGGAPATDAGVVANHAAPSPTDAAVAVSPPPPSDAGSVRDAAVAMAPPIDAGVVHTGPQAPSTAKNPPKSSAASEHLKAAEDALRQNNRLRQLAEADLALAADPKSARAKYLLADALIKGGDLDRGCAYLRALGRNPLAVARASVASCPP